MPGTNVADWMLEIISHESKVGEDFSDAANEWNKSPEALQAIDHVQSLAEQGADRNSLDFTGSSRDLEYPGLLEQLNWLLKRANRNMWRAPEYSLARNMIIFTVGLLFGSAYFQTEATTQVTIITLC